MISNGRICSPTSVKVFPSPAGKTVYLTWTDLELCGRERSFFRKSSANPRLIQKIIPRLGPEKTSSGQLMFFTSIWVIRQESCVQTWVRSTCTYVKESCLRKGQTVDTLHIFAKFGQLDGQWSWSWWSSGKGNLWIGVVWPLHLLALTPLLLLTVGHLAFSSSNACCKSACQHNK